MKKIANQILFVATLTLLWMSACKKREFDAPPAVDIPVGNKLTIADLKARYTNTPVHFENESVFGVVTMDEKSGNIYKNFYMQDGTDAINVRILNSGGIYQGDSIRIYLKGTVLSKYNGAWQLDSVDVDKNIIKQKTNVVIAPQVVNISQIGTSLQSKLIQINDVEFSVCDLTATYADAAGMQSANRTLEDCSGNSLIVRSSGYASFAGTRLAQGKGSIVGILSEYNGTFQLYIRNINEVRLTESRCPGRYLNKNFEDGSITTCDWSQQKVAGNVNWTIGDFGGRSYANISNYVNGVRSACDTWLISPKIDLASSTAPKMSFDNAWKYDGNAIQVYISTNYNSGLPNTAQWTEITSQFQYSAGNFAWSPSGQYSLNSYRTNNVHIAFRYSGSTTSGSTWEIDNVLIKE